MSTISQPAEALAVLDQAEQIFSEEAVSSAIRRMAAEVTADLSDVDPLVLSVMGGAVVFTGQILPLLRFPLQFDYIQASRYRNQLQGQQIEWKVTPGKNVAGRVVLLLDDILDEGLTLATVRDTCLAMGAQRVVVAVLTEKEIGRPKPITADYIGLVVPDRYVFGCGMDIHGRWRNLPAIYALK